MATYIVLANFTEHGIRSVKVVSPSAIDASSNNAAQVSLQLSKERFRRLDAPIARRTVIDMLPQQLR